MAKTKSYSAKEKLEIFDAFFKRLHFHRYISGNVAKINTMLEIADAYVLAASQTGEDAKEQLNKAFEKMTQYP